ncbi:uncharacterized protein A1O5_06415 [Cladophialophora psammophila CBS 110553]|uniref:Peptidase M48 domain-containing protein n=1 Tax=Cladophialophora psammophila CBS 110553 TaxID=1182543 RepID=W9WQA2_9EURO|nr:uncharacterized protein A1O5_06415 [Cladophialophora psammophila CBS 110553]EXJ70347.1 hypothetical protein A1O5_06415 [Cladophialophora psammophila CBS 110553]
MFTFRVFQRAASQAACRRFQHSSKTVFRFGQGPQFQPRRSLFWGPRSRYRRFGDGNGYGQEQGQQQQWSNFGPVFRMQYLWRNYQRPLTVIGVGGGVFYVYNLEEVPVTHRRRFNMISPSAEKEFFGGAGMYKALLQEFQGNILPPDHPLTMQVAKVVEKLLPTTRGLAGDDWRVHVINDPREKNAFVMPGGKVFVFSGILPICQSETGLAAVLGHEIAHNVAHHAAERASRSSFILLAAWAVSLIFDISGHSGRTIAELLLSLPNSRTQEAEADRIGLLMMAEACYDPRGALDFWQRMKQASEFEPPQFLSTHPSHYNRAEQIKKWLPDAERIYADTGCGTANGFENAFKEAIALHQPGREAQVRQQRPIMVRRNDDDDDDFF